MHVVALPRVLKAGAGPHGSVAWAPDFGGITVPWGQAGSGLERRGMVPVWVRCDGATLEQIAALPGARIIRESSAAEVIAADAAFTALRTQPPRWAELRQKYRDARAAASAGRTEESKTLLAEARVVSDEVHSFHRSPRADVVASYRERVAAEENEALAADRREGVIRAIAWTLLTLGAAAAEAYFGTAGVALALTALHTDTFNRSDRSLNGDTMSDTIGAWAADFGTWNITTNQCDNTTNTDDYLRDSVMSAVGEQQVTVDWVTKDVGCLTRANNTPRGYMGYSHFSTSAVTVYRIDSRSGFALLAGGGSAVGAGDNFGLYSSGSNHSGMYNGAVNVGPVSDANYGTGVAALYGGGNVNTLCDEFLVEVASASYQRLTLLGVG